MGAEELIHSRLAPVQVLGFHGDWTWIVSATITFAPLLNQSVVELKEPWSQNIENHINHFHSITLPFLLELQDVRGWTGMEGVAGGSY